MQVLSELATICCEVCVRFLAHFTAVRAMDLFLRVKRELLFKSFSGSAVVLLQANRLLGCHHGADNKIGFSCTMCG